MSVQAPDKFQNLGRFVSHSYLSNVKFSNDFSSLSRDATSSLSIWKYFSDYKKKKKKAFLIKGVQYEDYQTMFYNSRH